MSSPHSSRHSSKSEKDLATDLKNINADLEQVKEPVPAELDLEDRDPTEMNEFVKVSWEHVFAEPKDVHSYPTVWINAFKCYRGSKFWCYRICTLICGIPFAFIWGITFAMITFWHIWCVVPSLKAYMIEIVCLRKVWSVCIHTFLDPCYESMALMFSRIHVNFIAGETASRRGSHDSVVYNQSLHVV
ncbi:caveolin-1-like isoform X1 [Amphiura filiformis]|uniref:caveolin-1-like isoform X1 n=1 Tax=Amphiura filiformis TaxID=82378 RepID=UPI003B21C29A